MNGSHKQGGTSASCTKTASDRIRRVRDILLSLALLVIFLPFMLLVSLLIVMDSPGAGPIFSQTRVGRYGREFTFYKFRTMRPNAESELERLLPCNEMEGPVFKIRNDPRITRVGRFLRRSSLDELPQLINVLRGDMSLVGPRPGLPREIAQYDSVSRKRLEITPGMTCYWQIQPDRNSLSFAQWLDWDLKYIREQSFLLDCKILFKTIGTVLRMNGI